MLKQTDLLVDYYNFNRFLQHITHQSGNTETQKLDGHNKVLREMGAVIEEITNILENFGVDVHLQKLICRYHQSTGNCFCNSLWRTWATYTSGNFKCKGKEDGTEAKLQSEINWIKIENDNTKRKVMRKITW